MSLCYALEKTHVSQQNDTRILREMQLGQKTQKRNGLGNHPRAEIVPFLVRSNNCKRLVVTCLNADCEDSVETAICLPQTKTHGQPTPRTATALRRHGVRVAAM